MLTTTLNDIRRYAPCTKRWKRLLKSKLSLDHDTPFPLLYVLESNGPDDFIWCLRTQDTTWSVKLANAFAAAAYAAADAYARAAYAAAAAYAADASAYAAAAAAAYARAAAAARANAADAYAAAAAAAAYAAAAAAAAYAAYAADADAAAAYAAYAFKRKIILEVFA